MFKSILFTVFSLVCVFASLSDAKRVGSSEAHVAVANAMEEMGSTIDTMKQIHSSFVTMADGDSACAIAAGYAAANITADCQGIFQNGNTIDLSKILESGKVGVACDGVLKSEAITKCSLTFSTYYKSALSVCGASNATDVSKAIIVKVGGNVQIFANLTALVSLGKAICIKSDDNANGYCLDYLLESGVKTAFDDISKVSNTLANVFCKSCTKQIVAAFAGVPALKPLVDGLTFLCTTDPNNSTNFCMDSVKVLLSMQAQVAQGKTFDATVSALGEAELNQLCSPCTVSVLNSFDLIKARLPATIDTSKLKEYIPALKKACVRDTQNDNAVCPARLKDPVKGLAKWATDQMNSEAALKSLFGVCSGLTPTQCSAECGAGITNFLAGYGCCLGLVEKKDLAAFLPPGSYSAIFSTALAACSFSLPTKCAEPTSVTLPVTFVLENLRFAWATTGATNTKFTAAFVADIASAFSLDASAVSIKSIAPSANGGVVVTVLLTVDSSVVAGYTATIKSRIASSLSFGQTSAAASEPSNASDPTSPNGKIDQTQGVNAASTSAVGTTSAAVAFKASIATMMVTIVSIIAIKFF